MEKYINDNLEQLGSYEMPQGHKERFMARLAAQVKHVQEDPVQKPAQQRRTITFWNRKRILSAASAAAVVAIGLITSLSPAVQEAVYTYRIQKSAQQIYIVESEIMQMLGEDEQYMINSLKTITEEAVPLAEQLPAELSPRQRAEILIRYYKAKTASLKSFKTLYAQGGETDSEY